MLDVIAATPTIAHLPQVEGGGAKRAEPTSDMVSDRPRFAPKQYFHVVLERV